MGPGNHFAVVVGLVFSLGANLWQGGLLTGRPATPSAAAPAFEAPCGAWGGDDCRAVDRCLGRLEVTAAGEARSAEAFRDSIVSGCTHCC